MEKVSIVIPTYKRSDCLKRAVDSVLSQTYGNIEVLVVDDNGMGTEEGNRTAALMRQYAGDPRVRYIQNAQNIGSAMARNVGIYAASGEYIAFLDDDDMHLPRKTEAQLSHMKANVLDLCLVDLEGYNEKGERISEKRYAFPKNPTREALLVDHLMHHLTATSTFMMRTNALRRIGGFTNEPAMHEYLLMLKAIQANLSVGHLPEIHTRMYAHPDARVSTSDDKLQELPLILETKKSFFDLLTGPQKRFILCRHHGTIFFVRFLRKEYVRAIWHLAVAFLYTPVGFFTLFLEKKGKFLRAGVRGQA